VWQTSAALAACTVAAQAKRALRAMIIILNCIKKFFFNEANDTNTIIQCALIAYNYRLLGLISFSKNDPMCFDCQSNYSINKI
jgi:hypothetical protein